MIGHHVNTWETSLSLAPNARIYVQDGLFNGACGTVTFLEFRENRDFPAARLREKKDTCTCRNRVQPFYCYRPEEEKAIARAGARPQFPLRLAWASTILNRGTGVDCGGGSGLVAQSA